MSLRPFGASTQPVIRPGLMKAGPPPQSKPQGAGKPQERTREDESPMVNEKLDGNKKEKKKWVWDAPHGYDLKRDLDTKTIN